MIDHSWDKGRSKLMTSATVLGICEATIHFLTYIREITWTWVYSWSICRLVLTPIPNLGNRLPKVGN